MTLRHASNHMNGELPWYYPGFIKKWIHRNVYHGSVKCPAFLQPYKEAHLRHHETGNDIPN